MRMVLTNAGSERITVRLELGPARGWKLEGLKKVRLKNGQRMLELTLPARSSRTITWTLGRPENG